VSGLDVTRRDLNCVCCDEIVLREDGSRLVPVRQYSQHHRVGGPGRKDNRASNGLLLAGTGSGGCHWAWHFHDRAEAERLGYIVRRAFADRFPLPAVPAWYDQPSLARVGWYLLDDSGGLLFISDDPAATALGLAERIITNGRPGATPAGGELPPRAAPPAQAPGSGPGDDVAGAGDSGAGSRSRSRPGAAAPGETGPRTLTCSCGGTLFTVTYAGDRATSAACGGCGAAQLFAPG
jgi:hypothetical protein